MQLTQNHLDMIAALLAAAQATHTQLSLELQQEAGKSPTPPAAPSGMAVNPPRA